MEEIDEKKNKQVERVPTTDAFTCRLVLVLSIGGSTWREAWGTAQARGPFLLCILQNASNNPSL